MNIRLWCWLGIMVDFFLIQRGLWFFMMMMNLNNGFRGRGWRGSWRRVFLFPPMNMEMGLMGNGSFIMVILVMVVIIMVIVVGFSSRSWTIGPWIRCRCWSMMVGRRCYRCMVRCWGHRSMVRCGCYMRCSMIWGRCNRCHW